MFLIKMFNKKIKLNYIDWKYKNIGNPIYILKNTFVEIFETVIRGNNSIYINPNFSDEEITSFLKEKNSFLGFEYLFNIAINRSEKFKINWFRNPTSRENLTESDNFTFDWVLNEPDCRWNWYSVWSNKNTTIEIVLKWKNTFPFSSVGFASNPNLKIEYFYLLDLNCKTTRFAMSKNTAISFSDILKNKKIPWDWEGVSLNSNIDLEGLISLSEFLDFHWLSMNKGLTLDMINRFPEKKWNPHFIVENANMSEKQLKEYIFSLNDMKLWSYASKNPNISPEFIIKNKWFSWDWNLVFENNFLHDDFKFKKAIISDIRKRRKKILIYNNDIQNIINLYISYK